MSGEPFRIGRFFLGKRCKSDNWCACFYDGASRGRNIRRVSLGTCDLEDAKLALARFVVEHEQARDVDPRDQLLATVFQRYHVRHGARIVGGVEQGRSLALVLERAGEAMTVEQFNLGEQERVVDAMKRAGYAAGTIKRAMGAAKAAIQWNFDHEFAARVPAFLKLSDGEPRDRVLSIDEMAAFWDACSPPHVRTFFLLLLGTAARPGAVLDLTRFQCDVERRLIDLNPPGRAQTKKRRPVVPMTDFLAAAITEAQDGPLVSWRGRAVRKINKTWRTVREAAGLDADVVPYAVRHTVATELRARGVPELEIMGVLGHEMSKSVTGRYAKYRPDYQGQAKAALDEIAREIGRVSARPISELRAESVLRAPRVLSPASEAGKSAETGAGEGIRTLDPNLGKVVLYP